MQITRQARLRAAADAMTCERTVKHGRHTIRVGRIPEAFACPLAHRHGLSYVWLAVAQHEDGATIRDGQSPEDAIHFTILELDDRCSARAYALARLVDLSRQGFFHGRRSATARKEAR